MYFAILKVLFIIVLFESTKGFNTNITTGLDIPSDFHAKIEPFEKIGSSFYFIESEKPLDWFSAASKCHTMGGHLANLRTLEDLTALSNKIGRPTYWVDLTALPTNKTFVSITTGEPKGKYPKWAKGEPNNALKNEFCGQVFVSDGSIVLNDHPCALEYLFICESSIPRFIKILTW